MSKQKQKGALYERDVAGYFNDRLGLDSSRMLASMKPTGEGLSDILGVPRLAIEAKRVERLNYPGAMAQARRNAGPGEVPIVVTRASRTPLSQSTVCLPLDDFVSMYAAWIKRELIPPPQASLPF